MDPSAMNPVDLARREMAFYADLFNKMAEVCFRKCVTRYSDGDLQTGENVCVDRCVSKYLSALQKVGELLQETQQQQTGGAVGGLPSR
ncbi:hypothetical protein CDCA_CDCA18G4593 [Cyanidium caldarium]|uniref:Mitochondrial import inner membrane translocase subunit n=1 Tax=Cyanidium caldarium TaxID=2771 RepID=A0AAV9J2J7_CYACA|nr:hypothetical protein CDCA_CDCA18G4593 [Cyanidium caldarium]